MHEILSYLAQKKDLNHDQLAQVTGVDRKDLSRFFEGKTQINAASLCLILRVLGIPIDNDRSLQILSQAAASPTRRTKSKKH